MAIFISPIQKFNCEPFCSRTPSFLCDEDDDLSILFRRLYSPSPFSAGSRYNPRLNRFRCPYNKSSSCCVKDERCKENDCQVICDKQKCCKKSAKKSPPSFNHQIDVRGFEPSDLKFRFTNGKLIVMGLSCEEEEGFYNKKQLWKVIDLPEGLSPKDIVSRINDEDKLLIGLRKSEESKEETTANKKDTSEKNEEDKASESENTGESSTKNDDESATHLKTSPAEREEKSDFSLEKAEEKSDETKIAKPITFHHRINVSDFDPDKLNVSIKNGVILVTGSGTVEEDGMKCTRKMWRRFTKPKDVKDEDVKVLLDDEGVLTLTRKGNEEEKDEKTDTKIEKKDIENGAFTEENKKEKVGVDIDSEGNFENSKICEVES